MKALLLLSLSLFLFLLSPSIFNYALSLFFNSYKGPLLLIFYGTEWPLCADVPLKPSFFHSFIHSFNGEYIDYIKITYHSNPFVASIISKKAAEGLDALVLDIKYGRATFMKTKADALRLANAMVSVSKGLGIKTVALLTRMDNPIGRTIGNTLEIIEALHCLHGKGPEDLNELVCKLGNVHQFMLNCFTGNIHLDH